MLCSSGAEKATKTSSGSGVWGFSEPLGHCQDQHHSMHLWDQNDWDAVLKMTPQGDACLFLQTGHDKDKTSGVHGVATLSCVMDEACVLTRTL